MEFIANQWYLWLLIMLILAQLYPSIPSKMFDSISDNLAYISFMIHKAALYTFIFSIILNIINYFS
jgi:hypothetical protein